MGKYVDIENTNVHDYVTTWDCNCSEYGRQTVMAVDDVNYLPTVDIKNTCGWISIKNETPKKSGLILCYLKNSLGETLRIRLAYFNSKDKKWYEATRYMDDDWCRELHPTHWMTLPDAPICTPKSSCYDCFHNCGTWCDFENHCKKNFGETDAETDERLKREGK